MGSPKAILICSLLTTCLTIVNGWLPVGEWNHLYRSAEVMWEPRNIVNVRGRRIWISAFFLGKYGQYEIWLMLNCSKLEESMILQTTRKTAPATSIWPTLETKSPLYISSRSPECPTAGTSATLWSGDIPAVTNIEHGRWWRKPDGLITFADFLIKDRD